MEYVERLRLCRIFANVFLKETGGYFRQVFDYETNS